MDGKVLPRTINTLGLLIMRAVYHLVRPSLDNIEARFSAGPEDRRLAESNSIQRSAPCANLIDVV